MKRHNSFIRSVFRATSFKQLAVNLLLLAAILIIIVIGMCFSIFYSPIAYAILRLLSWAAIFIEVALIIYMTIDLRRSNRKYNARLKKAFDDGLKELQQVYEQRKQFLEEKITEAEKILARLNEK